MSFITIIIRLFTHAKSANDRNLWNTSLLARYVLNETRLLKFALEELFVKKNQNTQLVPLLKLFKKNCFFRDYIYLWQAWANPKSIPSTELKSRQYARFVFASHTPSQNLTEEVSSMLRLPLNILSYGNLTTHSLKRTSSLISVIFNTKLLTYIVTLFNKSFSFGFFYIQGFAFILFIDACLTDDEPLWEPVEWSLVQTWILFIFAFAWIAENLIVSRYGSYTGRDKRVWMAWYKTFWLIEGYYVINYGVVCVFVIVPFYFETNYNLSFVYSWWHWYSRVFFFKFISIFTIILFISYYLQMSVRWLNWKKGLVLILLVNVFLSYLIYTQFIMTFFGYFTDPVWYQKTRPVDYIQLSHEPARWGWGSAKKDHFTYHNVKTVFWFKNDGPFAASFLFFQTFLFVCIFLLYIYWITLFRRVYATKEIPLTYTTYCVSSLKQFFYFFLMFYIMIFLSYISNYSRFPIEFLWTLDTQSWSGNFISIIADYPMFLLSIFA
jgi:hypothetical protein